MKRSRSRRGHRAALAIAAIAVSGLLSIGVGASAARTDTQSDTTTISMLITVNSKPGWDVIIPNFERAYPNIRVDITYAPDNTTLYQLETTELAAGNATDVLTTSPGCGTAIAICKLAKAGYLAGMPNKPWAKRTRSTSLVTAYGKLRPEAVRLHTAGGAVRHLHERHHVQAAWAEDPADVLAAPRRLPEGEGRRNGRRGPRRGNLDDSLRP